MSLSTITINTVDYVSYASVAEADSYLAVDPVRFATWNALTVDQKGSYLVAATRRIDLMRFSGEKTGDYETQDNAWPRTGMVYEDGSSVSTTEVPQAVEDATILLAGSTAIDASVSSAGTSGNNIKMLQAGSASITYFRPSDGKPLQDESAFALLRPFLSGGVSSTVGVFASGTDQVSSFVDDQMGKGFDEGLS